MRVGTKSVLFGVHQFAIHPLLVFVSWWILYGFPSDLRLWVAFLVHDLGYIGKKDMDGEEGEKHVELGAKIMQRLFGNEWGDFCKYHSRFYAKKDRKKVSKLCIADKYVFVIEPAWLYLPRAWASGELLEYLNRANTKYSNMYINTDTYFSWHNAVKAYLKSWVNEHKDTLEDTWT